MFEFCPVQSKIIVASALKGLAPTETRNQLICMLFMGMKQKKGKKKEVGNSSKSLKQLINALMLGIAYEDMSIPLLWKLLPKKGSGNIKERVALLKRFIDQTLI